MGSLIAAVVTFTYATYTAGSMLYRANDLKMLVTLPVNEMIYSFHGSFTLSDQYLVVCCSHDPPCSLSR
jgi:hypothetical protein